MPEEFPGNSKFNKPEPQANPKKIEKIIEGKVVQRKKSLGKRMLETFIGGDIKQVGPYVLFEVIIPDARNMLFETVKEGFERLVFGENRRAPSTRYSRPGPHNGNVAYERFSSNKQSQQRMAPERTTLSNRARATHNFDEIILETRVEAEEVISRLFIQIEEYGHCRVTDLYDAVGITGEFTDEKWGWMDLRGAGVTRVRDGYLLDLPRPEPIK